jgi:hypothetical protein
MSTEAMQNILRDRFGVPDVELSLIDFSRQSIQQVPWKLPLFQKSYCRVYWTREGRLIEYSPMNRLLIRKNGKSWTLKADFQDEEMLLHVCRTFWLSVYGLKKELAGQLRLHAAGISNGEDCVLFWGPPGAGKTTITQLAIKATEHSILSDELCLFDGLDIQGVAMTLHQKKTASCEKRLEKIPDHRVQAKSRAKTFFVLRKERSPEGRIDELGFQERFKVGFRLWAGEGLHQMAEYHLTVKQIPELFRLGVVRWGTVRRLMSETPVKAVSAPDLSTQAESRNQNWIQALLKLHLCADE